jgi:hypothetical protein
MPVQTPCLCTHTYAGKSTRLCTHTHLCTHTYAGKSTCLCTHTHLCTHTYAGKSTRLCRHYSCADVHKPVLTHTQTPMQTSRTYTDMCTCVWTCAHTLSFPPLSIQKLGLSLGLLFLLEIFSKGRSGPFLAS